MNTLNIYGNSISDHQETANAFNKYFLNIVNSINTKQSELNFHNLGNVTLLHYLMQSFKTPFPNINLKSISTKEFENVIKSLKRKNSSGYDGISTKLIKICSPFISPLLTHILNKSLCSGNFPDHLKFAVVKNFYLRKVINLKFLITDQYPF
jgi:hypothetical protein